MLQQPLFSMDNFQPRQMATSTMNQYQNREQNIQNMQNMQNMRNMPQYTTSTSCNQIPPYIQHSNHTMNNPNNSNLLFNSNNTYGSNKSAFNDINFIKAPSNSILNFSSITNPHNNTNPFQYHNNYNSIPYNNITASNQQIEDNHSNSTMSTSYNAYDIKPFKRNQNIQNAIAYNHDLPSWQPLSSNSSDMSNTTTIYGHSGDSYSRSNHSNNNMNNNPSNHCVIHGCHQNNIPPNFSIPITIIDAVNNNHCNSNVSPSTGTTSDADNVNMCTPPINQTSNQVLAPHVNIECAVCSTICATREILISHSQRYHKKICGYCGKKFARNSNLKEHIRIHTGFTPYVCSVCHRGFKQQHSLKDHIRTHTGEKPFECELCGKRFTVKNNLKVHQRVHTGEKPYQCHVCYKRFTQKGSLNTHLKKVHKVKLVLQRKGHKNRGHSH